MTNSAKTILKNFQRARLAEFQSSTAALNFFDGEGSVRLLDASNFTQKLEWLDGDSLLKHLKGSSDARATLILLATIKRLHSKVAHTCPQGIPHLKTWFDIFSHSKLNWPSEALDLLNLARAISQNLLDTEKEAKFLHGDLHHENIIYSSKRGWLAIDPKGVWGDPHYECANLFYNPQSMPDLISNTDRILLTAQKVSDELGFDFKRVLQFAFVHGVLSAAWSLEDGQSPHQALEIAKKVQQYC